MTMSLNRAQIIGNLTRDPEVRQTPNGVSVASFGVATNFRWTDQSGQIQERVEFHNIVAWRKLAEICAQYLHRGSKVFIEGKLQTRDWEGEDGVKRYKTEIVADNMIMLDKKGASSDAPQGAKAFESFASEPAPEPALDEREAGGIKKTSKKAAKKGEPVAADKDEDIDVEDLPF